MGAGEMNNDPRHHVQVALSAHVAAFSYIAVPFPSGERCYVGIHRMERLIKADFPKAETSRCTLYDAEGAGE
jgi:hypothetical protein